MTVSVISKGFPPVPKQIMLPALPAALPVVRGYIVVCFWFGPNLGVCFSLLSEPVDDYGRAYERTSQQAQLLQARLHVETADGPGSPNDWAFLWTWPDGNFQSPMRELAA